MNNKKPLDPDTLTPGARRILDAASELFYDNGITAVGVDLVAERSGVTKRTLYNRFGSKDVLVATYLFDRVLRWRASVQRFVEAAPDPSGRLLALFDALQAWTSEHPRGCALINALAETPDPAHPAHRVALDEKRWLRDFLERTAEREGLQDPSGLAVRLFCLHEGALAMQTTAPDLDGVRVAGDMARDLVRAAL